MAHRCFLASVAFWRRRTSVRQFIGAPKPPAPLLMAHRTQKMHKNVRIRSRQGEGIIRCANNGYKIAFLLADRTVRCASPIFKPIAYKLSYTNWKRKYVEEKTTATLKIKQTSIATVRNHILTVACFPTPLSFHYLLPLNYVSQIFFLVRSAITILAQGASVCQ